MENTNSYSTNEDLLADDLFSDPVAFAGFWLRFAAYFLDFIFIYLGAIIIILPMPLLDINVQELGHEGEAAYEFLFLGLFLLLLLYFPLMESSRLQATLGKKIVGIKVTDMHLQRIGFGKALGRFVSKLLSAITIYIGFIMIAFTKKKQGLHDLIAETLVIKSR